jgi:diamine N-acetyltransferase
MPSKEKDDLVVRGAVIADAAALAELAERTFRKAFGAVNDPVDMDSHCASSYGSAIQARELADPQMTTLVVERATRLIAYGQLRRGATPPCVLARSPIEIQRFYVDQDWHGQGVAQMLMTELIARADAIGTDTIWLGVWERNPRAIAFYQKFGFTPVGSQIFQVGRDPQRDLVLSLARGSMA